MPRRGAGARVKGVPTAAGAGARTDQRKLVLTCGVNHLCMFPRRLDSPAHGALRQQVHSPMLVRNTALRLNKRVRVARPPSLQL